ncbi:MAG: acetylxylan esterase, partial [Ferruginibacter sp.]|nr:acetylxylan esterase [Cytophagales bacterium]
MNTHPVRKAPPRSPLLLGWILFHLSGTAFAQPADSARLCQGNYYTEAQGKAALARFGATYRDRPGWEERADRIRRGIRQGAALEGVPQNTPLKPRVRGRRTYDGYTVENVAFESLPGFFVTGNLYRPVRKQSSYAAILSPHGHGPNLRFGESVQKRCATLARMGA